MKSFPPGPANANGPVPGNFHGMAFARYGPGWALSASFFAYAQENPPLTLILSFFGCFVQVFPYISK